MSIIGLSVLLVSSISLDYTVCMPLYFFPLQTNTFQCVLFTNGAQSHVLFLYADGLIQWTAARSIDLNALAGVNAGDGVNYAIVPESLNISIINVSSTTNVGVGGMWLFRIDTGTFGTEEEREEVWGETIHALV